MSERRAKIARCEHGKVHAAHVYTVGNPTSEAAALTWVAEGDWSWAIYDDVPTEDINFGNCEAVHE